MILSQEYRAALRAAAAPRDRRSFWLVEQVDKAGGQVVGVGMVEQQPLAALAHQLLDAALAGHDDGDARGHGLEDGAGKA